MTESSTSYLSHIGKTFRLAWPVIAGQLGHIIIANADVMMIGHFGSEELAKNSLAAASLANGLFYLILVIGFGVCMGISPLVAQARGAGNDQFNTQMMRQSFWVCLWLSFLIFGLVLLLILVLPYLNQPPEVVALTGEYLFIIALSAIPLMIFLAYRHFIEGFAVMLPGMLIMFGVVLLNIFLNWVFIYGNLGFPALGLNGAGWATLLSRVGGLLFMVGYLIRSETFRKYIQWPFPPKYDWDIIRKILAMGLPTGFQFFFEVGAFSGAVILAGWIGSVEQSAHQIAINLAAVTFMIYTGISAAASIRVGHALGAGQLEEVRRAGYAAILSGGMVILVAVPCLILFREVVPAWYIDNEEVVSLASSLLLIAALFQTGDGLQAITMGALRGISDVKVPTVITFVAYWVVGLPLAYLLAFPFKLGLEGVWYGLTSGLVFSALFLLIRFELKSRRDRLLARAAAIEAEEKAPL